MAETLRRNWKDFLEFVRSHGRCIASAWRRYVNIHMAEGFEMYGYEMVTSNDGIL